MESHLPRISVFNDHMNTIGHYEGLNDAYTWVHCAFCTLKYYEHGEHTTIHAHPVVTQPYEAYRQAHQIAAHSLGASSPPPPVMQIVEASAADLPQGSLQAHAEEADGGSLEGFDPSNHPLHNESAA